MGSAKRGGNEMREEEDELRKPTTMASLLKVNFESKPKVKNVQCAQN